MESTSMPNPFIFETYEPPKIFDNKYFHFRALEDEIAELDYEAVMSSQKRLQGIFGSAFEWPRSDMTLEESAASIKVHKQDGVFFSVIMISILFYGYAQAVIAPQSALGSLTSSGDGFVFWSLLVISLFVLFDFLAKKYSKVVFFYSE